MEKGICSEPGGNEVEPISGRTAHDILVQASGCCVYCGQEPEVCDTCGKQAVFRYSVGEDTGASVTSHCLSHSHIAPWAPALEDGTIVTDIETGEVVLVVEDVFRIYP